MPGVLSLVISVLILFVFEGPYLEDIVRILVSLGKYLEQSLEMEDTPST